MQRHMASKDGRGAGGDPHYVTFADEHYSYQGVGVFSLVSGVYHGAQFDVPQGLTDVRVLDYDETQFINFEVEIFFP